MFNIHYKYEKNDNPQPNGTEQIQIILTHPPCYFHFLIGLNIDILTTLSESPTVPKNQVFNIESNRHAYTIQLFFFAIFLSSLYEIFRQNTELFFKLERKIGRFVETHQVTNLIDTIIASCKVFRSLLEADQPNKLYWGKTGQSFDFTLEARPAEIHFSRLDVDSNIGFMKTGLNQFRDLIEPIAVT